MPARIRFGSVRLTAGKDPVDLTPTDDTPFRVLVLADLGGATRPGPFRTTRVDRDNFDALPGTLGVAVRLPGVAGETVLPIRTMDDFHPGQLWATVPAFDELRSLRRRLQNPATFAEAAAEVASWDARPAAPTQAPPEETAAGPSLLEEILGKSITDIVTTAHSSRGEMDDFLRRVGGRYSVPTADPRTEDLTHRVDAAAGGVMRTVLHHPRFRAIEAAWRGLAFLVRRLDTDRAVHLHVVDVSKAELAGDLAADDLTQSKLYDLLVRRSLVTAGGSPWSLAVGDYAFGPTAADAELLARIGAVVARAGAGFVAGGASRPDAWSPTGDDADAWGELRGLPQAAHLGLAAPRFLLRAPYANGESTVGGFDFDESPATHEEYLWGNPALAWAYLLGDAFDRAGWRLRSAVRAEVGDLPLAATDRGGETELVPCAETLLTREAAERLDAAGLSVLGSVRGADRVEFASLVSLAAPPRPLAGRWDFA